MKALLIVLILSLNACSYLTPSEDVSNPNYFENMKGCFLLYNMKTKVFDKVIGQDVCKERFSASSTFKVALSVMAFDANILKDENEVLKWDGVKRNREELNQDHNAKTWMRDSVVWFSQRLTPKLGKRRLKIYLQEFRYGNENLAQGITQAWLAAPDAKPEALKISAYEQVDFMKRLWTDQLKVSKRSMQITRDITYLETSPKGFQLHGKTGSNSYKSNPKLRLGWFIAHLSNQESEYIVVTNLSDITPPEPGTYGGIQAKMITKNILADLGLW